MKLLFKRSSDEKLCYDEYKSIKKFGKEVAQDFFDLMSAIDIANNLKDIHLPNYRLHPLKGNKKDIYSLSINKSSKYRIEFYPIDENDRIAKCKTDLNTFYKTIETIEIIEITEHYEK